MKKKIMVTGGTGKIGEAICKLLLEKNYQVILIARNEIKAKEVVNNLKTASGLSSTSENISYMIADLSKKNDIINLAKNYKGNLDVLINNAAVTPIQKEISIEGLEMQFSVNILSYIRMADVFLDALKRSNEAKIINVASYYAGGLDLNDIQFENRKYDNNSAYRQSKQANRMLTITLAEKYKEFNISVNSCHPGEVNSTLSNNLGFRGHESPTLGAMTPVFLVDVNHEITGKYFEYKKIHQCQFSKDKKLINKLFNYCKKNS